MKFTVSYADLRGIANAACDMHSKESMKILFQDLLNRMTQAAEDILGEALTGVYLHGSLAMGCFNPKKSDIDLIVVIDREMTDQQKWKFMEKVAGLNDQAPKKGLELSVVREEVCRHFVYPTPFELHFSPAHLKWWQDDPKGYIRHMKGTDPDLAAHFTIIRKYGIALAGAAVEEVFGEVPREAYLDSIRQDVENASEDVQDDPVYVLLNLCRAVAYAEENLVLSKQQGGEWGLAHLPEKYHFLIQNALEAYRSDADSECQEAYQSDAVSECPEACQFDTVSECPKACQSDAVSECLEMCQSDAVSECPEACQSDTVSECPEACQSDVISGCLEMCQSDAVSECPETCQFDAVPEWDRSLSQEFCREMLERVGKRLSSVQGV